MNNALHKFCISLLLAIPLSESAMETSDSEWSTHTFNVTKNAETGDKTYVGTYPVHLPKSFVRVKTANWRNFNPEEVNITVDRHAKNQIIITAVLAQRIVAKADDSEHDSSFKEYGWIWMPWFTDVTRHPKDLFKAVAKEKLRGDNRLSVEIREPGTYHIMLPADADAEIKTKIGNIDYKSQIPTMLHIASKTVNKWGDSGCSTEKGEIWSYNWATAYSPQSSKTRLKSKKGHINIP